MQRKIKFRAWDKSEKRYWTQEQMEEIGGYYYSFRVSDNDGEFVLEQFTGLKDKNGKEIYEGDILQWPKPEQNKGTVVWSDTMCSWMMQREDYSETFSSFAYPRHTDGNCRFEVIGNLCQNPKRLK